MEKNSIDILLDRKNVFIGKNKSDITNIIIDEVKLDDENTVTPSDTDAWLLLADYDVSDVLGLSVRYSEWETGPAAQTDKLTIQWCQHLSHSGFGVGRLQINRAGHRSLRRTCDQLHSAERPQHRPPDAG